MTEKWKEIPNFPGYEVSNWGRVRSYRTSGPKRTVLSTPQRIMKPSKVKGYPLVSLWQDGKQLSRYIHHLVLLTFVGPRPEDYVACHYNDIRTDNRLENLRWDSRWANAQDARRNGRI